MIGIYALTWQQTDKVYIGQSIDILARFKQHCRSMQVTKLANYKVIDIYNKFGLPELVILEECKISDLDFLEVSWINEFNSIKQGLNIVEGGANNIGTNNFAAKYSQNSILKALSLLSNSSRTLLDISNRLNIQISTLSGIVNKNRHCWLEEKYPVQYAKMLLNRSNLKVNANTKYPPIIGPDNIVYNITNVKEFCREHPLLNEISRTHLNAVMCGKRKQHKGFKLLDPNSFLSKATRPTLIDPDGVEFINIINITEFCEQHELLKGNINARKGLSRVFNKEREVYLGFKLK